MSKDGGEQQGRVSEYIRRSLYSQHQRGQENLQPLAPAPAPATPIQEPNQQQIANGLALMQSQELLALNMNIAIINSLQLLIVQQQVETQIWQQVLNIQRADMVQQPQQIQANGVHEVTDDELSVGSNQSDNGSHNVRKTDGNQGRSL